MTLHPVCAQLRQLRLAARLSLGNVEHRNGIPAETISSYERGDRQPNLHRVDRILAIYGHRLAVEPLPAEPDQAVTPEAIAAVLRLLANQIDGGGAR